MPVRECTGIIRNYRSYRCEISGRDQVAQIVRDNNCGLIYATGDGNEKGWTYKRSNFTSYSSAVNDIGNYGQIIRLNADNTSTTGLSSNLITITEEHQVKLGKTENWSDAISLSSADDFALLSIAMNSEDISVQIQYYKF